VDDIVSKLLFVKYFTELHELKNIFQTNELNLKIDFLLTNFLWNILWKIIHENIFWK
jgi:hypothetical protein